MNYQIKVPKIHCSGCVNLIKISLEDTFENVNVDQESKIAEFTSEKQIDEVKNNLDRIFDELKQLGYEYTDLKLI